MQDTVRERVEAFQGIGQVLLPADDEISARHEAVHNGRQGRLDDFIPVVGEEVVAEKEDMEAPFGRCIDREVMYLPADAFPEFIGNPEARPPGRPEETGPRLCRDPGKCPCGINAFDRPLQVGRVDVGGPEIEGWHGACLFRKKGPEDSETVGLLPQGTARRPDPQPPGMICDERRENLLFQDPPQRPVAEKAADGDVHEAPGFPFRSPVGVEALEIGLHRGASQFLHVPDDALLHPLSHLPVPFGGEGKAVKQGGKFTFTHRSEWPFSSTFTFCDR